jgi:hypothetical protein
MVPSLYIYLSDHVGDVYYEPTDIDFLEEVLTLSVSMTAVNSKAMIDVKAFISW